MAFAAASDDDAVAIEGATAIDERWPVSASRLKEADLSAVIGVPMNAFAQTIGVINIYRRDPVEWSAKDIEAAEIMALVCV